MSVVRPIRLRARIGATPVVPADRRAELDLAATDCVRRVGRSLSVGLFVVFYWFSVQKFAPGISPAEEVAARTVQVLTLHLLPLRTGLLLLASWEMFLGAAILFFPRSRFLLLTTFAHLSMTFTTFVVFPELTFGETFGSLTLLGQYVVKNLVLLGGLHALIELSRLDRVLRAGELDRPEPQPGPRNDREIRVLARPTSWPPGTAPRHPMASPRPMVSARRRVVPAGGGRPTIGVDASP